MLKTSQKHKTKRASSGIEASYVISINRTSRIAITKTQQNFCFQFRLQPTTVQ